ncbi:NAD(P)/FAD-dependent oxidoreductase [Marihabitans asiaticum]|uniref:Phytoene dehydrogenase-like protein n=1 Tax=Marihabitans asiaticum TaxID=415218 RepID=A0A560WAI8_9MICO|nr:NAD(P)/FAD-dependent oxidoreductase [Marihabitans asiaticum]TWD14560.1 phytoene dehydrogenase-like protein [Marihabitans asiaticum]
MSTQSVDVVVIGAGHHGLVAACELADAGWDVLVLEGEERVGGAVASRDVDGWVMDEFSACHPLGLASPVLRGLELDRFGLEWAHAPAPVTHVSGPLDVQGSAVLARPEQTAELLEQDHPGDGEAWLRLCSRYRAIREPLWRALLTQWPPTTSLLPLVRSVGVLDLPDLARFALLPVAQMGREIFGGARGREILAGNALHADIPPDAPGSGLYGWVMSMLAQDVGFPSPKGGARVLAQALRSRAEWAGAQVETGRPVRRVRVEGGRATAVETEDGQVVRARRGVVADTSAPDLYRRLLDDTDVPGGLRTRMERFVWDLPTLKLDYRLSRPMPWRAQRARGAAVVHAGRDLPGLVTWAAELGAGRVPDHPFALVGQMATVDPTRAPHGGESLWLYTHLPRQVGGAAAVAVTTERCEQMLDELAPGWRDGVVGREHRGPGDLEEADPNLGEGAIAGGTMQLFQQAIWRPTTGLGGPRTHIAGLYLGSAAIHPGGGVHGGCGHLAARAALRDASWWGRPTGLAQRAAIRAISRREPRW